MKQSFKSAVNWKYYLSCLLLFAFSTLIALVAGFFAFEISGIVFGQPEQLPLAFGIGLFAVLLLAWTLAESLISGIAYNLALSSFGKKPAFKDSVSKALKRLFPAFLQQLVLNIAAIIVLCVIFAPLILHVFHYFAIVENKFDLQSVLAENDTESAFYLVYEAAGEYASQNLLLFVIEALAVIVLAIVFLPAILLLLPCVFFGRGSALASIREALRFGFRNFFSTYAFAIVLAVLVAVLIFAGMLLEELSYYAQDAASYYTVSLIAFLVGAFSYSLAFLFFTGAFRFASGSRE